MRNTDKNTFNAIIQANAWLKTPCNSILPRNRYFCVLKGDFAECPSFELKMTPIPHGIEDAIPFDDFKKIGDYIVGDGYIVLFTTGSERPGCMAVRFSKRCARL